MVPAVPGAWWPALCERRVCACPMAPLPAAAPRIVGAGLGDWVHPRGGHGGLWVPPPDIPSKRVLLRPLFFLNLRELRGEKFWAALLFGKLIKNSNRNVALH